MNSSAKERNHVEPSPSMTKKRAKSLLQRGRRAIRKAREGRCDPPRSRNTPKCSLETAVSCHMVELMEFKEEEVIRPALARAIWVEYAPYIVFGKQCKAKINHKNGESRSEGKIDAYEFFMWDSEDELIPEQVEGIKCRKCPICEKKHYIDEFPSKTGWCIYCKGKK